jgi:RNA polymerase sigma factor (sigma-70 family)
MLGSVQEAEDLVQETMLRAWRAYDRYDPDRASMRTWLYCIATSACLNALEGQSRRPLPSGVGQRFDDPDAAFLQGVEVPWLQPIPDRLLAAGPDDPGVLAAERSGLRLAVAAALQLLPASRRRCSSCAKLGKKGRAGTFPAPMIAAFTPNCIDSWPSARALTPLSSKVATVPCSLSPTAWSR